MIKRQTHDLAMNREQDESRRFCRIRPGPARPGAAAGGAPGSGSGLGARYRLGS